MMKLDRCAVVLIEMNDMKTQLHRRNPTLYFFRLTCMHSGIISFSVKLQALSGIYIHIPFCKQACHYCNFHFSTSLVKKTAMMNAIFREMEMVFQKQTAIPTIETIYFGGGTPSLLEDEELETSIRRIQDQLDVHIDAEITLEINPDDLSEKRLENWRRIGINRLSVGIQSFDESELQWMNRAHNHMQALEGLKLIKQAGFSNFSADLIFGSPFQTDDVLKKNLSIMLEHKVPHLSCYGLTMEQGTAYALSVKKKKDIPVQQAQQARQFHMVMDTLVKHGYSHYEISNYALPGYESKHNSSYWKGKSYLGLGPSAHSFDGHHIRSWNIANNSVYLEKIEQGIRPSTQEELSEKERFNEMIMISLRLESGLDLSYVQEKFGAVSLNHVDDSSSKFIRSGWLIKTQDKRLKLTRTGKLYADHIAAEMFLD